MHGCLSAVSIQNLKNITKGGKQKEVTSTPEDSDKINQHHEIIVTYKGPFFSLSRSPSLTSASTPTPSIDEFSSLAINTATTVFFRAGFFSPNLLISSVTSVTCPRQSVVPRPLSLSPSTLSENGSKS